MHFLIHESKLSRVAMSSGSEFHSLIVGGKKEYLMWQLFLNVELSMHVNLSALLLALQI